MKLFKNIEDEYSTFEQLGFSFQSKHLDYLDRFKSDEDIKIYNETGPHGALTNRYYIILFETTRKEQSIRYV